MRKDCNRIVSYDEIIQIDNLMNSYRKAKRKNIIAGFDGVSPKNITDSVKFVNDLHIELKEKMYEPKDVIKQSVMKYDGTCMINFDILCFSDRVIQIAIKNKLLPLFNKVLFDGVCGYRGRQYKKRYFQYIEKFWTEKYKYIVSFDIKNFFKSINKQLLIEKLKKYCDELTVETIEKQLYRDTYVMPLGHVLSPLLSNIYLNEIDHIMYNKFGQFIRFGDNYVFPIKEDTNYINYIENELDKQLKTIGLELNKSKTLMIEEYKDIGIL